MTQDMSYLQLTEAQDTSELHTYVVNLQVQGRVYCHDVVYTTDRNKDGYKMYKGSKVQSDYMV